MLVRQSEQIEEPSLHGTPKAVILRGGVLPNVTQVAVATLRESDVIEPHRHPTMYEIYYVLEGEATYHVAGEPQHVAPGDFLVVPPGAEHFQQVTKGPHRVFYWGISV